MRLAIIGVLAAASSARAEPVRAGVDGYLGLGTPVGNAGIAAEASPVSWLSFAAGAGVGRNGSLIGNQGSTQVAVMARLLTPGRLKAYVGVGPSVGGWSNNDSSFDGPYAITTIDRIWWLNFELGAEYTFQFGLHVRIYGGSGDPLKTNGYHCDVTRTGGMCPPAPTSGSYLGFALGYRFSVN
jgi:hypothetical protein